MALNYETLIRAASKSPEHRTATEITEVIVPWLKQSLKKKQGIFQKISDGKTERFDCTLCHSFMRISLSKMSFMIFARPSPWNDVHRGTWSFSRTIRVTRMWWRIEIDVSSYLPFRFYIILKGAVNIYRLDDDNSNPIEIDSDTTTKFAEFDTEPDKREQLIAQTFGSYVVTLGKGKKSNHFCRHASRIRLFS